MVLRSRLQLLGIPLPTNHPTFYYTTMWWLFYLYMCISYEKNSLMSSKNKCVIKLHRTMTSLISTLHGILNGLVLNFSEK